MQYLWINPVSAGMCEEDSLKRFLERHGLTRVECRGDWGRIVRERYEASLRAGVTLADARCPEAVRLLEEIQKEPENESGIENLKVAPIEPILLHCARELRRVRIWRMGRRSSRRHARVLRCLEIRWDLRIRGLSHGIVWRAVRCASGRSKTARFRRGILRESAGKMDRRRK